MKIRIYQIDGDKDINRVKFDSFESMKKYSGLEQPDASIYENVYEGKVNAKDLEDVYSIFNTGARPGEFRGHSLSKSDIVEVIESDKIVGKIDWLERGFSRTYTDLIEYNLAQENLRSGDVDFEAHDYVGLNVPSVEPGFYYVDSFGFEKVEFEPEKAFKRDDLMRVVMIEPEEEARIVELDPSSRGMQCAVQGHIEVVSYPFSDNARLICNEDFLGLDLPPNRLIRDTAGSQREVICGTCFICAVQGEDFVSLSPDQAEKYKEMFLNPQEFTKGRWGEWKPVSSLENKINDARQRSEAERETNLPGDNSITRDDGSRT